MDHDEKFYSEFPRNLMSPRHHVRTFMAYSDRPDEYEVDREERKYLDEYTAYALKNAVSYVSPI